jgi:hypothetical protein
MKKREPPTDTDPRVGVRLASETSFRKDEMDLQGQTGEVIECSEGKRVTVRFANGRLLMGRDAKLFDLSRSRLAANWLRCVSLASTSPYYDGETAMPGMIRPRPKRLKDGRSLP